MILPTTFTREEIQLLNDAMEKNHYTRMNALWARARLDDYANYRQTLASTFPGEKTKPFAEWLPLQGLDEPEAVTKELEVGRDDI